MVAEVIATHGLSQRRACGLIEMTRRSFRRAPTPDRNRDLRQRLRALAEERRRWGCPMLYPPDRAHEALDVPILPR
jgi:putative transposase